MGRKKAMIFGAAALLCCGLAAGSRDGVPEGRDVTAESRDVTEPEPHPYFQEYELETDMTEFEGNLEDITA